MPRSPGDAGARPRPRDTLPARVQACRVGPRQPGWLVDWCERRCAAGDPGPGRPGLWCSPSPAAAPAGGGSGGSGGSGGPGGGAGSIAMRCPGPPPEDARPGARPGPVRPAARAGSHRSGHGAGLPRPGRPGRPLVRPHFRPDSRAGPSRDGGPSGSRRYQPASARPELYVPSP